jgi:hypothetical protein
MKYGGFAYPRTISKAGTTLLSRRAIFLRPRNMKGLFIDLSFIRGSAHLDSSNTAFTLPLRTALSSAAWSRSF